MQIDITECFNACAPRDYSASIAEIGADAGAHTWRAACDDAPDWPMLDSPGKLQAMRDYVRGFGAWDDAEIAGMPDLHLQALFLQFIAGDMREAGLEARPVDWQARQTRAESGSIPARIYPGDDGRVYFYLGE